ncbi:hypothetical protein BDV95DRAFT_123150 [Massariosphaeria phaeospora]|uniref:Uncharacterized protein n=1 Tax=Massariosphaeria phaeospora TaxID=100035 RepID=A0A7C8M372_9PLEO|nr:hypothetical protein BDV95DRAFT_123150 [Massariosphaeria phaeospora]
MTIKHPDVPPPVNTMLHVYAIGLIIWSLMRLTAGLQDLDDPSKEERDFSGPGSGIPWHIDPHDPKIYSARLENLLRRVLVTEPAGRIKLKDLLGEVDESLVKFGRRIPGIATMQPKDLPQWLWVADLGQENWKVGEKRRQQAEKNDAAPVEPAGLQPGEFPEHIGQVPR